MTVGGCKRKEKEKNKTKESLNKWQCVKRRWKILKLKIIIRKERRKKTEEDKGYYGIQNTTY